MRAMIESFHVKCAESHNGEECITLLLKISQCHCKHFRYLFLDYNMPDLSGGMVLQLLKARNIYKPHMRIYIVSGGLSEMEQQEILQLQIVTDICKI